MTLTITYKNGNSITQNVSFVNFDKDDNRLEYRMIKDVYMGVSDGWVVITTDHIASIDIR